MSVKGGKFDELLKYLKDKVDKRDVSDTFDEDIVSNKIVKMISRTIMLLLIIGANLIGPYFIYKSYSLFLSNSEISFIILSFIVGMASSISIGAGTYTLAKLDKMKIIRMYIEKIIQSPGSIISLSKNFVNENEAQEINELKVKISKVIDYYNYLINPQIKQREISKQEMEDFYELMHEHNVGLLLYLLYNNKLVWFKQKSLEERLEIEKQIDIDRYLESAKEYNKKNYQKFHGNPDLLRNSSRKRSSPIHKLDNIFRDVESNSDEFEEVPTFRR